MGVLVWLFLDSKGPSSGCPYTMRTLLLGVYIKALIFRKLPFMVMMKFQSLPITKELFVLVVQGRQAQKLGPV